MNASDVINAIGASPGIINNISSSGAGASINYTATTTIDLVLSGVLQSTSLAVNAVNIATAVSASGAQQYQVLVPVQKGQTVTISLSASGTGTCLIAGRAIR